MTPLSARVQQADCKRIHARAGFACKMIRKNGLGRLSDALPA